MLDMMVYNKAFAVGVKDYVLSVGVNYQVLAEEVYGDNVLSVGVKDDVLNVGVIDNVLTVGVYDDDKLAVGINKCRDCV